MPRKNGRPNLVEQLFIHDKNINVGVLGKTSRKRVRVEAETSFGTSHDANIVCRGAQAFREVA
jgi:hypothetical protein